MNLEDLNQIERLEAPKYLYAKIVGSIEEAKKNKMPTNKIIAFSVAFVALISINTLGLMQYNLQQKRDAINQETLLLVNTNNLYHE